ncbi:MAG: GNAT family N-acetyltransferase [Verrucomicrobiaceae bacterium]|nr:GNAT family N-acetyltransferase [Verrucomicrobiaceae bacterium]
MAGPDVEICEAEHGSSLYAEALKLRYEVLRKPLGLTYSDEQIAAEKGETHLVAVIGGQVVGSLSLVWECDHVRLRQMAVGPDCQGMGLGRTLLTKAEELASLRGRDRAELHARMSALGFYQKAGYAAVSGEYVEVGLPHRTMSKALG